MLALEILVNARKTLLAGVEDWDLLHADISAKRASAESADHEIEMTVDGLALPKIEHQHEHFRWGRLHLSMGDEVTIRLVDVAKADTPIKRFRSDKDVQESPFTKEEIYEMQKQTYLDLKKKFGRLDQ